MPGLRSNTLVPVMQTLSAANVRHLVLRTPARNRVSSRPQTLLAVRPTVPSIYIQSTIRMNSTYVRDRLDPFQPHIETDDLALPLEPIPLPTEIFHPPPTRITSAQLQRLHKLAAIAPPAVGSKDEVEMLQGLEGLLGLMDQVKNVKLDNDLVPDTQDYNGPHLRKEAIRKLLASGNYADPNDIFDGSRIDEEPASHDELPGHEAVVGKDLLAWRSRPMER